MKKNKLTAQKHGLKCKLKILFKLIKILNKIIQLIHFEISKNKIKYLTHNCFPVMKINMKKVFLKINTSVILSN